MDQAWIDGAEYGDFVGMQGAGSICPARIPGQVFARYRDHYPNDLVALARTSDLAGTRRWFTSFGSCSVQEPLEDLVGLGLVEANR